MYLPEDLVLQILVRLPPKSVSRFRSVCKAWQAIIDGPSFMNQYLMVTYGASSHDRLRLICQYGVFGPTSTTFLLSDEQIIDLKCLPGIADLYEDTDRWFYPSISGPINGIYCIQISPTQSSRNAIMFWNPGNGQFHVFPPIPEPDDPNVEDLYNEFGRDPLLCCYGGFAFDPLSDDYKFILISEYGSPYDDPLFFCFHVYSLASNSWQQLDPLQLACPALITINDDGRARFVPVMNGKLALPFNRSCHWIYYNIEEDKSEVKQITYMLSFDIVKQAFRRTTIPRMALGKGLVNLTTVDGCLAAVSADDGLVSHDEAATIISVGIMKEYGVEESWIKAYRIVLNAPGTFLGVVEDELFVRETDGWVVSYSLRAHQEDYNEYCYVPFQRFEILPFAGSFIPINPNTKAQLRKIGSIQSYFTS